MYSLDNYKEAINASEADQWIGSLGDVIESLKKNLSWQLVPLPEGQKIVHCKYVFKKKQGSSGTEAPHHMARKVAKGFTRRKGIDFNEVFSLMVSFIRVILLIEVFTT